MGLPGEVAETDRHEVGIGVPFASAPHVHGELARGAKGVIEAGGVERAHGSFSRSMSLPVPVAHDGIRARYVNGVLEVVVPKAPSAQQRDIKVET